MFSVRLLAAPVGLMLVLAACATEPSVPTDAEPVAESASELPADGTPRLVLFLVVDQLRADYLDRFRPLFEHGFDRLLRESIVFSDTHHDHAWTKTAPGHASLATGVHPSRHGIVSNSWWDPEHGKELDSDEDERYDEDRSPYRLEVPTMSDRMKERWPESKVFGASGKSRGAILPAGRHADRAFWMDDEIGRFVTSNYYGDAEPAWLAEFHRDAFPDRFFGSVWEPLPAVTAAGADFRIESLDRGIGHYTLPRPLGRASVVPDESYYEDFYWTPFSDRYLLELVQRLIVEEELGVDSYPDFLSVSFSAVDLVGHAWGPDSPEILDTLLRLDRVLGELLDFVDERIGLTNVVISLSADHGVSPVPEISIARGYEARRFGPEERKCMQGVPAALDRELGDQDWFAWDFTLSSEAVAASGRTQAEVESVAARLIEACPGVERVWTSTEIEANDQSDDPMMRLHRNNFFRGRSPDLFVQFEAWSVPRTSITTTHGSPYPYDTHVPWLLRLPSGEHRVISERALTVDVAPTLAPLVGVDMGAGLDGRDRLLGLE